MNRTINRVKWIFVGVFALANVAILVWQLGWISPMEKCGAAHKWWDNGHRVCAQPILISDITGRVITDKAALAAAKAAVGRKDAGLAPRP